MRDDVHAPGEPVSDDAIVKTDPELARIADRLGNWQPFRAWAYAHALDTIGRGWVEKIALYEHLQSLGVVKSWRNFNHILKAGHGTYWTIRLGRAADGAEVPRLYLTGYVRLAESLTRQAVQSGREALVATNRPGHSKVYVDLSGSVREARARVYSAWLSIAAVKAPVSRQVLRRLWGKAAKTLLEYEDMTGVKRRANFAQHHDPYARLIPVHAYLCQDDHKRLFASWRIANSYTAKSVNHARKGNARKARKAAHAAFTDTPRPVEILGDGMHHTGRLYFADKQTKRGFEPAFKQIDRHLKKHGDIHERRHYIRLMRAGRVQLWEYSVGIAYRVKRNFKGEKSPEFQRHRQLYKLAWEVRGD